MQRNQDQLEQKIADIQLKRAEMDSRSAAAQRKRAKELAIKKMKSDLQKEQRKFEVERRARMKEYRQQMLKEKLEANACGSRR